MLALPVPSLLPGRRHVSHCCLNESHELLLCDILSPPPSAAGGRVHSHACKAITSAKFSSCTAHAACRESWAHTQIEEQLALVAVTACGTLMPRVLLLCDLPCTKVQGSRSSLRLSSPCMAVGSSRKLQPPMGKAAELKLLRAGAALCLISCMQGDVSWSQQDGRATGSRHQAGSD